MRGHILFTLTLAGLVIFRLWLVWDIPKLYFYTPQDDLYFARAAGTLLDGGWLGDFNQLTLVKAPFYPLFLALSARTGLPLMFNETLVYLAACGALYAALRPLWGSRWLRLAVCACLAYCPAGLLTIWTLRVYRESVYFSLTLFVLAAAIGLLLRIRGGIKPQLLWAVGLGAALGAFWLTREEGVWIAPALAFLTAACAWLVWNSGLKKPALRIAILIIPYLVAGLPVLAVQAVNQAHYGYWGVSDQLDADFNRVISVLARIKTDAPWYPYVSVTRESLRQAYAVSPALAAIREPLDQAMDEWERASETALKDKPVWYLQQYADNATEIGAGHFPWVLRDAISRAGYFAQGVFPHAYLHRLAGELTYACSSGQVACSSAQEIPFAGSLEARDLPVIAQMGAYQLRQFFKLAFVNPPRLDRPIWDQYTNRRPEYAAYDRVVHNPPGNPLGAPGILLKYGILRGLYDAYRLVTLPLAVAGLIAYGARLVIALRRKSFVQVNTLVIATLLAILGLVRFVMLVVVDATTTASGMGYGASIYLFLYLFIATAIFGSGSFFPLTSVSSCDKIKNTTE